MTPTTTMLGTYSFSSATTNVQMSCPKDVTAIERVMLGAQGDLQRLLSSFLSRPIEVKRIYANTSPRTHTASIDNPITQERQVHLICSSELICVATSSVIITSYEAERIFLDEKYAIGQVFQQLRRKPQWALLDVQTAVVNGKRTLERTYTLETEGFFCRIREEFVDRDLFDLGEEWFSKKEVSVEETPIISPSSSQSTDFFNVTPFSSLKTPSLPEILAKQAANPAIAKKPFAVYPTYSQDLSSAPTYAEITYSEFSRLVEYQAKALYDRIVDAGLSEPTSADAPVIAVLYDSGFHLAVIVLALLKLNATVFLLSSANSQPAISHLLASCNVSVFLYGPEFSTVAQGAAADSSILSIELGGSATFTKAPLDLVSHKDLSRVLHPSSPEIPIIVHSSGSTAFPKPVRWSNASFLSNSQVMLTSGNWSAFTRPNNRFLCLGPLIHTLGLTIGLGGTICGGSTIVFPLTRSWPPSPSDVIKSLRSTEVKTCVIVPLLLEQLVDTLEVESNKSKNAFECLSKLDLLITGGAHCPETLAKRLITRGVNLKNIFGSSETGHLMIGSHERSDKNDLQSWKLVKPFPHTSVILKPIEGSEGQSLYQVHVPASDVRLAFGVLKDGEETWNTGDVIQEMPAGSGTYQLLYRDDDILVHVSGEKTNPIPMEIACRENSLIERIAIIGHRRPVTAAIIQLNEAEAIGMADNEISMAVRQAIMRANFAAPRHSRVVEEMIFILPIGYEKRIPITPKGNCIRPKVLQVFAEEIDAMYRNFEGDSDTSEHSTVSTDVTFFDRDIVDQVKNIIEEVAGLQSVESFDGSKSLFELGLDSVTAMRLRKQLSTAFGVSLPSQFVYQNFSLDLLSQALLERVAHSVNPSSRSSIHAPEKIKSSRAEILSSLLQKQIDMLRAAAPAIQASHMIPYIRGTGEVVGVLGAAGSLGIWQVKSLLDRPDVKKVVCLVRGKEVSEIYEKLSAAFSNAGLNELAHSCQQWRDSQLLYSDVPAVVLDQRLVVMQYDFSNPQLESREYFALASHLTTIIHTGWKMDFNQVVQEFEHDCLFGTTQLLILAAFMRPKQFYFISSIGVVLESKENPVPETFIPWSKDDHISASPHGYSESKFIAENMINAASKLFNIPCSLARVGQISGDTISGVWKTREMNVLIIAGSARIGKYPVLSNSLVDWIPVDFVAASTVELALQSRPEGTVEVHHIVNPTPSSYNKMVQYLYDAGLPVTPSSAIDWWKSIQMDEGNPCLAIESYIEEAVVNVHAVPTLDLTRTLQISPNALARCPPLDGEIWTRYVQHWQDIGFLPKYVANEN